MKSLLPLIAFAIAAPAAHAAIVATEVGNNAPGTDSDNEYVVILNTGTAAVDLSGYEITDAGTSWDAIGSITVGAGQSLVISAGADQPTIETAWGYTIPSGALFTVISGLAQFNNSGSEEVNIRDASQTVVYTFSFDTALGSDTDPLSIGLGSSGGTGGESVTPFSTVQVPEASTLLVGSLGFLMLLRRRR